MTCSPVIMFNCKTKFCFVMKQWLIKNNELEKNYTNLRMSILTYEKVIVYNNYATLIFDQRLPYRGEQNTSTFRCAQHEIFYCKTTFRLKSQAMAPKILHKLFLNIRSNEPGSYGTTNTPKMAFHVPLI